MAAHPVLGWAWWPRPPHVGGSAAQGLLELGKQGIVLSDAIVADLHIPIMQEALELQDDVFRIADEVGVGPEVRAAVYALRGASYASTLASGLVPAGAVTAGAGVFAGIGAVAALGAVAVVGAIAVALFGGGESDAEYKARKRAQAQVLHLRDRLTLAEFAAEQQTNAAAETGLAMLPAFAGVDPVAHQKAAEQSKRLALFYQRTDAELPKNQRALFESLSNLARWQASLEAYGALSQSKKDALDVMFGKSAPRLPYQLKAPMQAELETAQRLTGAVAAEQRTALGVVGVLVIGAGALALWHFAPGPAAAILRGLVSAPRLVYTRTKGLLR